MGFRATVPRRAALLRRWVGSLLLLLAPALSLLPACEEDAAAPVIKVYLSATRTKLNHALGEMAKLGVAVTNLESGRLVVVARPADVGGTEDIVAIRGAGSTEFDPPRTLVTDLVYDSGAAELLVTCVAEGRGVVEVSVWEGDQRQDVASELFECYYTDPDNYTLSLSVTPRAQRVGMPVEVVVTATDDKGNPAPNLDVDFVATGATVQGATPAEGEEQRASRRTDTRGTAKISLVCPESEATIPVRVEFQSALYEAVPPVRKTFSCYVEEGNAAILLQPERGEVKADDESTVRVVMTVVDDLGVTQALVPVQVRLASVGRLEADPTWAGPESPRFSSAAHRVMEIITDEEGSAAFLFKGGADPGVGIIEATATITPGGSDFEQEVSGTVTVDVVGLGSIEFMGAVPPILGVKGYGYNEQSVLTFQIVDSRGEPFPAGTPVEFSIPFPVRGVAVDPSVALTDQNGQASTLLHAGTEAAPVSVRAEVTLTERGRLLVDSPSIPIIGVYPTSRGMGMRCDLRNVGGLVDADGVNSYVAQTIPCTVRMQDRFGNAVGLRTNVSFRSEAGTVVGTVSTAGVGPETETVPTSGLGIATTLFSTFGTLPKDVAPLEARPRPGGLAAELPAEPRRRVGARIHNPRDGLATILAYTQGEEWYLDVNGNGTYDAGEPFEDLGEPFVDENDNNIWDSGEPFIDIADDEAEDRAPNGRWDGPNGVWDRSTAIWTDTRILYTGLHDPTNPDNGFLLFEEPPAEDIDFRVQKVVRQRIVLRSRDINLNLLNASTTYRVQLEGALDLLPLACDPDKVPDAYGIDLKYFPVCANQVCRRELAFLGWGDFANSVDTSGYEMDLWITANAGFDDCCCGVATGEGDFFASVVPEADRLLVQCLPQNEGTPVPPEEPAEGEPPLPDDLPIVSSCEAAGAERPVFIDSRVMAIIDSSVSPRDTSSTYQYRHRLEGLACGNFSYTDNRSLEERLNVCVTGRLVDEDGQPVAAGGIQVRQGPESIDPVLIGGAGAFCSPSPRGVVTIEGQGVDPETEEVICTSESLEVTVERALDVACEDDGGDGCFDVGDIVCVAAGQVGEGEGEGEGEDEFAARCLAACTTKAEDCGFGGMAPALCGQQFCPVADDDALACLVATECLDLLANPESCLGGGQ